MAESNSVTVEVKDGVSTAIPAKIDRIAASARTAHTSVEKLQQAINGLNGAGLERLNNAINSSASSLSRLTQAQNQQNSAAQNALLQQQRLATETARTATQQQRLQTETSRTATQQQRLATESGRTATQTQRLGTETARTAREQTNAATAAIRQQQAQARLDQTLNGSSRASNNASGGIVALTKNILSLTAALYAAKQALDFATNYTVINNKIKTVTDSIGQQETLLKKLTATALETSTGLDVVAQSFIRFDRPMKMMGKTQEETIRLITTINKELANTGATTAEASSAVLQLGQAFGSGKLQGDEFRAISETMPTLLDAVAKAMGVTTGEVKKLGSDGKITSEILLKALTDMQAKTDATFAKTQQTVPQALQNVKTALTIAIGEMDKALGITNGLAQGLNYLSKNMDVVGFAVTALGAALLIAFVPMPNLLNLVTVGFWKLTAAITANPFGALAVAITTVAAALIFFADDIAVTSDGLISLQDVGIAVFGYIKEAAGVAGEFISSVWDSAINWINEKTNGWGEQFRNIGGFIVQLAKSYVNFVIGFWAGAYDTIKLIWNNLPAFMDLMFTKVVNLAAGAAENVVNSWQIGLRAVATAASSVAPEISSGLNGALDKVSIKLPRMTASQAGETLGKDIGAAMSKSLSKDYVGNVINKVMTDARKISNDRRNQKETPLRGAGENTVKKLTDEAKKGKTKKEKSPTEKLTDEQKAYKKALDEINKPLLDYNAALKVADELLSKNAISQAKHDALIAKAKDEYSKATDPMYSFNKAAQEQTEILNRLGIASEAETQVIQARNAALQAGLPFTVEMANKIRETVDLLDMQQRKHDALNQIWESSIGKQRELKAQQEAYTQALKDGMITQEQYNVMNAAQTNSELQGMGIDTANFPSQLQAQLDQYAIYNEKLKEMREANRISESEYASASLQNELNKQNIMLNKSNSFFGNLAALQKSSNKKMAAVGKAAAIAQAMIQTYQSATSAYAAMASIPYVGPVLGAAAAAAAIAAGLANVRQIKAQQAGFKTGGYTGNMGVNDVAGVVHGQEFVMNASATSKYRPLLESMNNGNDIKSVTQQANNAGSGNGQINVNIQNFGTSKDFEVEQLSETDIRIIARDEADKSVKRNASSVVAKDFGDANSEPSKALSRNTTAQRSRL